MDLFSDLKEDAHWFVEMAFIAINKKNESTAIIFLDAAKLLDPNNLFINIAFASIHLHKMELEKAKTLLEGVLSKEPTHVLAKTFLAMVHTFKGDGEKGREMFDSMKDNEDPNIRAMVKSSTEFIKKAKKG